jgi:hypothetical protein
MVPHRNDTPDPEYNTGRPLLFVTKDALSVRDGSSADVRTVSAIYRNSVFAGDKLTLELELPGGTICAVEAGLRMTPPAKDSAVTVCVDERLVRFVRG